MSGRAVHKDRLGNVYNGDKRPVIALKPTGGSLASDTVNYRRARFGSWHPGISMGTRNDRHTFDLP
jgi:hypothetical protein